MHYIVVKMCDREVYQTFQATPPVAVASRRDVCGIENDATIIPEIGFGEQSSAAALSPLLHTAGDARNRFLPEDA